MAQQVIGIGTFPSDGTGDPARTAFQKVNSNFTELYASSVLTTAESAAGVTPANFSYPPGNLRRYGATGNGVTDDSLALKQAIQVVNASYALATPVPAFIYAPAGSYLITNSAGTMPAFAPGVPGRIVGDGTHKTYFQLATSYVGDLFAWSESWMASAYVNGLIPSGDKAGPSARDFTVIGNTGAASQQNVFRFYDRNDFVVLENIDAYFINGQFFSCGRTLNQPQAYMRESQLRNLRAFYAGTASQPAVEISSTATSGSDATNEIAIYGLNVFSSAGRGVVVSNPNNFSSTRAIRFYQLRSEGNAGDAVTIGLATDAGQTSTVSIFGLDCPGIANGAYGLVVNGAGPLPYAINVFDASIVSGVAGSNGINIGAANGVSIQLSNLSVQGTPINVVGNNASLYSISSAGQTVPVSVTSAAHTTLPLKTPAYFAGPPLATKQAGFAALTGTGSSTSAIRLTADGAAANGANIFNPPFSTGYNISVQLVAQDTTSNGKAYTWTLPNAYFSAYSGAGTAVIVAGTPVTATNGVVTGASVSLTADTANGGLNLSFTPPTGNTDTWKVGAILTWAASQ